MATDDEIVSNLETLLSQADLAQATHGSIREQLEAKLGQDLSHKKLFIRHQIDLLAHKHQQKQQQQQQQQHFHHHLQHTQGIDISYPPAVPLPHSGEFVGMPTSFHAAAAAAAAAAVKGPYEHVTVQRPVVVQEVSVPVPVPVPVTKQSRSTKQASNATPGVKRRGGPGGLNKVCGVSPELQAVVGEPAMPRTQIVKQLWAYIRKNNLQDPSNKRKIICDEALRVVFETDCTDMFKMNKLLAKHILPLEAPKESAAPEPKRMKPSFNEDIKAESSGAGPPLIMSPSLAKFFSTGERELPQAEAVNRIWTYIQMNRLQDPATSMVVCDYRLAELFGCERFPALSLSEMLVQHFMHR